MCGVNRCWPFYVTLELSQGRMAVGPFQPGTSSNDGEYGSYLPPEYGYTSSKHDFFSLLGNEYFFPNC